MTMLIRMLIRIEKNVAENNPTFNNDQDLSHPMNCRVSIDNS